MHAALAQTDHRPWPMPKGPWIMAQDWHDLMFMHWPVDAAVMRAKIPHGLELDLWQGRAWIGVVPFRMSGVRPRFNPSVPWLSAFPELNVRTYVIRDGKPGVYFFSLDAANPIAVALARAWFHLPYFRAAMRCEARDGWIEYASHRTHRNAPSAELKLRYRAIGEPFVARPGTQEHWLTERYCLYACAGERIWIGEIQHAQWPLQQAEAEMESNTMQEAHGFTASADAPLLLFSKLQRVVCWNPKRLV